MKIISTIKDLIPLNLTATRVSKTNIQFHIDGKMIHEWVEPCLGKEEDGIWYAFEINGVMYDVNHFWGEFADDDKFRISFYGLYVNAKDADNVNAIYHTDHDTWHTIEVINAIIE